MAKVSFETEQQQLQGAWFTENLREYQGYEGAAYRVAPGARARNLAPGLQKTAPVFFGTHGIQWHQHANHGLSSQVCCVNFLMPFADKPELLRRWLEHVLGGRVSEVLPVEGDGDEESFVTFEWIGPKDHLSEARDGAQRARGANATASDAAVSFRDAQGRKHLLLIEWKYTERYSGPLDSKIDENGKGGNNTRRKRYAEIFLQPDGPIRADTGVTLDDFFYEPFYQLLRQQMLAWHTQRKNADYDRVRVLHLSPAGNVALHKMTSPNLRRFGTDAFDVFRSLLADPSDFLTATIEQAFAPLAGWPEADWYPWLRGRYASLCQSGEGAT